MDEKIFNSIDKKNSRSRIKKFRRIWDFVCVSNDGRVFHFSKISRLITFSVFLMFLLTVYSCVLSWFYLLERKNLQILTENYIETEHKLQDVSRERDSAVAKLALAGEPEKKALPVSEKPARPVMKVEPALPVPAEEKIVQGENLIVSNSVTLENFSAKKSKGNGLNIRFSVKPKTDEKILKGYIFSALMPDSGSPPSKWKIFPKSGIENDRPVSYEKGLFFSARGEKEITIKLKASKDLRAVKIFLFDDSGNAVCEEVFSIDNKVEASGKKSSRR